MKRTYENRMWYNSIEGPKPPRGEVTNRFDCFYVSYFSERDVPEWARRLRFRQYRRDTSTLGIDLGQAVKIDKREVFEAICPVCCTDIKLSSGGKQTINCSNCGISLTARQ